MTDVCYRCSDGEIWSYEPYQCDNPNCPNPAPNYPSHEREQRKMPTRPAQKSTPPRKETSKETPKSSTEFGERIPGSLSGNLTMNPELRFTVSGRAVCNMQVAVNERVKNDETGQWEDTEPEFWRVNVWGQQAEHAAECLTKGDRIVATGYFQDRTWETKEGEERTTTEFTAQDIGPSLLFREVTIKRVTRGK